jgi:predicted MFS family arabinose efflux permease
VVAGAAILLIPIPIIGLLLRESPQQMGLLPDGESQATEVKDEIEGLTWREIRTSGLFWFIIGAFALLTASVQACIIHMPQMLVDRGASAGAAALAVSVIGFAVMAGRCATGYLLDYIFGPYLAVFIFALSSFAIAVLWTGVAGAPILIAAFVVGFGFGAELDIVAYLMGRYFGLRSLGTAFGFGFGAFVLAGGVGPFIMGFAFDYTGSYGAPLAGFSIAALLASGLLSRLGPYRFAVAAKSKAPRAVCST